MTWALCLNCGGRKFGALCPCPKCQHGSTGDSNLDIAFSDHHISVKTIEQFGAVIRAIHAATDDPALAFWTFIAYVSEHHSQILRADPPAEVAGGVTRLLATLPLPPVVVTPGRIASGRAGEAARPAGFSVAVPPALYRLFRGAYPFDVVTPVEVLLRDGSVISRGMLTDERGKGVVYGPGERQVDDRDVVAIRRPPGRWSKRLPWSKPPPWVRDPDPPADSTGEL